MFHLIRALLTSAAIICFVGLGTAATATDPAASPASPQAYAPSSASPHKAATRPGATVPFTATAYCQRGVTQSGVDTHSGIVAADPAELPVGSVVRVETDILKYNGIYTVLDTGSRVQGHKLDLFMHDCNEAQHFGRKAVRVTVLRKGWSPRASAAGK